MTADSHGVLILYNRPRPAAESGALAQSEAGVLAEVQAVRDALSRLGRAPRAVGVARLTDVPEALRQADEPIVFNLVEGFDERPEDMAFAPALCRAFGKEATGGDTPSLIVSQDKWRAKAVLGAAGLPTPPGVLVAPGAAPVLDGLPGPYLVKPLDTDASEGIHADSSVFAEPGPGLDAAVRRVHEQFGRPALVERCVGERELNVSILEVDGRPTVLPLAEIDFSAFGPDRPRIVDYAAKWLEDSFAYQHTPRVIPAPVGAEAGARIRDLAIGAWRALGCRDYARVDFRLDEQEQPVILEVNVNPDVSPDAGFAAALGAAGIPYEQFVRTVVANAAARLGRPCACAAPTTTPATAARSVAIRFSRPDDRDAVLSIVENTRVFRPEEIDVAREVLDDALARGPQGHYQSLTAEADGRVLGWLCFGPTPCTVGAFDIYWIAVAPLAQRRGVGAALMHEAERRIAARDGRLIVVETSGRPDYTPTRRFYRRLGYQDRARLADFYAPGDDKVIFTKQTPTR